MLVTSKITPPPEPRNEKRPRGELQDPGSLLVFIVTGECRCPPVFFLLSLLSSLSHRMPNWPFLVVVFFLQITTIPIVVAHPSTRLAALALARGVDGGGVAAGGRRRRRRRQWLHQQGAERPERRRVALERDAELHVVANEGDRFSRDVLLHLWLFRLGRRLHSNRRKEEERVGGCEQGTGGTETDADGAPDFFLRGSSRFPDYTIRTPKTNSILIPLSYVWRDLVARRRAAKLTSRRCYLYTLFLSNSHHL